MIDDLRLGAIRTYPGSINGLHGPSVIIEFVASDSRGFQSFNFLSDQISEIFREGRTNFYRPNEQEDISGLAELAKLTIHTMRYAGIPLRLEFSIRRNSSNKLTLSLPTIHSKLSVECFKLFLYRISEAPESQLKGTGADSLLRKLISQIVTVCKPYALRRQNPKNLVLAAYNLGLPVTHISESYVGIGLGSGYRRFVSSFSEETSVIGVNIARCKYQTSQLLKRHGLPVAKQIRLGINDDPITVAEKIGFPVVVKPSDRDGGQGVHAGVKDGESLRKCLNDTRKHSNNVIIEKFHEGSNYRVTLFNGVIISATQKFPGGVRGDGVSPICSLIATQQQSRSAFLDPYEDFKPPLVFDNEAAEILAQLGLSEQTVLQDGEFLALRRRTNAITGGVTVPFDMAEVHPDNLHLFQEAVRVVGLDICGVDYISADISKPWHQVGGIIVELNAQPQMGYTSAYAMLQELARETPASSIYLMLYRAGAQIQVDEIREILLTYGLKMGIRGSERITHDAVSKRAFRSEIGAVMSALQDRNAGDMLCVFSDWEFQQWGFPVDGFNALLVHPTMASSDLFSRKELEVLAAPYTAQTIYLEA